MKEKQIKKTTNTWTSASVILFALLVPILVLGIEP